MLKIQRFIKEYPNDFKELLAEKPYFIKTQEDEHFILLKYSQIHSDFSNELVRECRGIILDKKDWSIAKRGFNKFGNYGESYVPEIDWDSAVVQEKLDGSLIAMFWNKYDNKWQIGTNGTINARNASLQLSSDGIENFYDLVLYTLGKMYMKENNIND